jgi:hypothetical protein
MIKNIKAERRQYPRIEQRLPIKLAVNGYDFITSTHNVSCVGAYCHVTKYMPPFTKVVVKLTLPIITDNGNKNYNVVCKGVVVRAEDESGGGFNIAVFFNEINTEEKKKISEYIKQFLPKDSSVLNRV